MVNSELEKEFVNIYTFNEWKNSNWKKTFEKDQTSILTSELSDNQFRVFKWVIQSLLADAKWMQIHFASRVKNNNRNHEILGCSKIETLDLL